MTINFDNQDNIKNLTKSQIRESFNTEHSGIRKISIEFVSDKDSENEKDITKIMGGNFDGKIGSTMQSFETGDCWILTDVNSLNTTEWGKKMIKEAIKPHEKDGVVVTLKVQQVQI